MIGNGTISFRRHGNDVNHAVRRRDQLSPAVTKVLNFSVDNPTLRAMKVLFRAIVFLVMLFAVLYVGINNTHLIDFSFPVLMKEKIRATAALLYFAMFAVGVVAGIAIGSGGKKNRSSAEGKKKA